MHVYGLKVGVKIPSNGFARKGDGLGCRKHVHCRHNHKHYKKTEHWRTTAWKCKRRSCRQQHPRNLA